MARALAALICLVCTAALLPALPMSFIGWGWTFGLDWPAKLSAAAFGIGPVPLAGGAWFGWKAQQGRSGLRLLLALASMLAALAVYWVAQQWGGRMLI